MSLRQQAETIAVNAMGVMHKATLTNIEKITLDLAATEIEQLVGAQLAESAGREVQLREALGMAESYARFTKLPNDDSEAANSERLAWLKNMKTIADAIAALPSTAAAEMVALRELEIECADHQCAATGEIQNEGGDRSCGICDALAVVAVARAGTP